MTRAGASASPQAPRRIIYRTAFTVAAVFMIALVVAQYERNGAMGLRDARFVGLVIAVGILAFRSGYILARGYETLARATRAQRRQRK
jgi:hypothetical protein